MIDLSKDYGQIIVRYYFKNLLDSEGAKNLLSKKEYILKENNIDFEILKQAILTELSECESFIGECKEINLSSKEIIEEIDFLFSHSNNLKELNGKEALEFFEKKLLSKNLDANSVNESENKDLVSIENRIVVCENKTISLLNGSKIVWDEKYYLNIYFEEYFELMKEKCFGYKSYIQKLENLDQIANFEIQKVFKNMILESLVGIEELFNRIEVYNYTAEDYFRTYFSTPYEIVGKICELALKEKNKLEVALIEYKELQKMGRGGEFSFFVGNIYAMGAYGAYKGVSSLFKSFNESSERKQLKNNYENQIMSQFIEAMEEMFKNNLLESFNKVYEVLTFAINIDKKTIGSDELDMYGLITIKSTAENRYDKIQKFKDTSTEEYLKKLIEVINYYPLNFDYWKELIECSEIDDIKIILSFIENKFSENQIGYGYIILLINLLDAQEINESFDLLEKLKEKSNLEEFYQLLTRLNEGNVDENFYKFLLSIWNTYKLNVKATLNFKEFQEEQDENSNILNLVKELLIFNKLQKIEDYNLKNYKVILKYSKQLIEVLESNLLLSVFSSKKLLEFLQKNYLGYIDSIKDSQIIKIENINNQLNEGVPLFV